MGPPNEPSTIDWGAALTQHDRWLRCVVIARLGERQGVDEVMQEVGLAAVRQKAPIHDPTKVAPWLYRIAVTLTKSIRSPFTESCSNSSPNASTATMSSSPSGTVAANGTAPCVPPPSSTSWDRQHPTNSSSTPPFSRGRFLSLVHR